MRLTKKQQEKIVAVLTEHAYDEKYVVILKENHESPLGDVDGVGFFNTQKEVREYINSAVRQ